MCSIKVTQLRVDSQDADPDVLLFAAVIQPHRLPSSSHPREAVRSGNEGSGLSDCPKEAEKPVDLLASGWEEPALYTAHSLRSWRPCSRSMQLHTQLQGPAGDMIPLLLLPRLNPPSHLEASPCPFVLFSNNSVLFLSLS